MRTIRRLAYTLTVFVSCSLVLEIVLRAIHVPRYLFPLPSDVVSALSTAWISLAQNALITIGVAAGGLIIGLFFAAGLGLIISYSQNARSVLLPALIGFQAVPIVALAPFFLIWFGSGAVSKTLLAAIVVYFPATLVISKSLILKNREGERLLKSVGASKAQLLRYLYVPASVPALSSAAQVTASLAVIGAVVAELAGSNSGLGFVVLQASYNFNTGLLFAALLVGALASFALTSLIGGIGTWLERRYGYRTQTDFAG